jgi:hypothetical protein
MIPTVASLRSQRRRVETRLERAELVLTEMKAGCALHLQHTPAGFAWVLSNGRQVSDATARLVVASASVVDCGDALFAGTAAQTWRWWR